jgi:hypothetical protein
MAVIRRHRAISAATYLAMAAFVGGVACGGGSEESAEKPAASCRTGGCMPTALATMQRDDHAIAANATSVYWARAVTLPENVGAAEIVECAKAGCNGAPTILASDRYVVSAIAVDATNVYWADASGVVMKVGLAGGTPTTLFSGPSGPVRMVVDATNVYWATNALFAMAGAPGQPSPTAVGAVMKVPIAGGNSMTLASNLSPVDIAVDGTSVYWTNGLESESGTVMKVAIDGGVPTTLASGLPEPADLAVDGTYVYWTEGTSVGGVTGSVKRVPVGGGTPSTIASQQAGPYGIAVDATSVYWTNNAGGTVFVAPLGGGASSTLAAGQDGPRGIVVDATGIYWANEGTGIEVVGSVVKMPLGCCGLVGGGPPESSDAGQDGSSSSGGGSKGVDGGSSGQEGGGIDLTCTGASTCASGQVCCAIVTSAASGLAATSACQDGPCASNMNTYQLCAFPSECFSGATCEPNPIGMGPMICTSRSASGDGGPLGDGG